MGLLGLIALFLCKADLWAISHILVSSIFLVIVSIGGIIQYNQQELVDFREIYRERLRIQTDKIKQLTEALDKAQGNKFNNSVNKLRETRNTTSPANRKSTGHMSTKWSCKQ